MRYPVLEALDVRDPDTLEPVARDGETLGEVMMRGNVVMKGYLKNKASTEKAFEGGWFHTGDLGVMHPDGYIQLKDRSKDIIISGGENISSIEVEDALYKHPAVLAAAVVAKPDEKWGETPCAFVELKPGASASARRAAAMVQAAPRRLQSARAMWCSRRSRRRARGRFRNSSCGKWRRRCDAVNARTSDAKIRHQMRQTKNLGAPEGPLIVGNEISRKLPPQRSSAGRFGSNIRLGL